MHDFSFYSAILGLSSKWRISDVSMGTASDTVEIHIVNNDTFHCDICGAALIPSGFRKARWLHHNRLNIRFNISALIPLVSCPCCGELTVSVPWEQSCLRYEEDGLKR